MKNYKVMAYLTEEIYEGLRKEAYEKHISMNSIIIEALELRKINNSK